MHDWKNRSSRRPVRERKSCAGSLDPARSRAVSLEPLEQRRLLDAGGSSLVLSSYDSLSPEDLVALEAAIPTRETKIVDIGDDAFLQREYLRAPLEESLNATILTTSLPDPGRTGSFDLVYHLGSDLTSHPDAADIQAALTRIENFYESRFFDPITVHVDVDYTTTGFPSPFVAGLTTVNFNNFFYTDVRSRLIADASDDESLVNDLPASGSLSFDAAPGINVFEFPGSTGNPVVDITRANAQALGFTDLIGVTSAFTPSQTIDGSVILNSGFTTFSYDFDPTNGITAGQLDFEAIVRHEIGHVLGFFSAVDSVDALVGLQPPKFDFGTSTSLVEPGYIGISSTDAYNALDGYGWLSGTISEFDRGAAFTDLERDLNATEDGTFAVDLPNGVYQVTLTVGDRGADAHDHLIYLEGATTAFVQTNPGEVKTSGPHTVNLTDGQLTIRLEDIIPAIPGGASIIGIEVTQDPGNLGTLRPTPVDLFRIEPNQGASFDTAQRVMNTGQNVPIQVFHDGKFDVTPFAGVDLNEDSVVDANDMISTGDIPLATGRTAGDGHEADHYKSDTVTGVVIGMLDPNIAPGELGIVTDTDFSVFGLIGYDIYNVGGDAPTVGVNNLFINDATPPLTGTVSNAISGAATDPDVFISIPTHTGTNYASLTVDGNSNLTEAFLLQNDGDSIDEIDKVTIILPRDGSNGSQLFAPHFSTGGGGSASPFRDFEADPTEYAATGVSSPANDGLDNESVEDLSKVLEIEFGSGDGFDPGEILRWGIDIDPGGVTGSELAGSTFIVHWDNGLAIKGTSTAVDVTRTKLQSPGTDTQGAAAFALSPSGPTQGTVDRMLVRFSEPIQPATFTLADVVLVEGPGGAITPTGIIPIGAGNTDFEVTFASQSTVGAYNLRLGPDILDVAGNQMDQDRDGVNGETSSPIAGDDRFSGSFNIIAAGPDTTPPEVVFSGPFENTTTSIDRFNIVFSEPIAAGTFTTADIVALYGPNGPQAGAITPTAVNSISSTEYEVTFPSQTALGDYQLIIGTNITDGSGNALSVDASYVEVSQPHAFAATNNLDGTWTLPDNTLPSLTAGTYNVVASVFDSTNALALDVSTGELVIDLTAPTADVVDVSPDPRNTSVSSVNVTFSQEVTGVDVSDFTLTRDGGGNLLSGSGAGVTSGDNITYSITGLDTITGGDGDYILSLNSGGSGIQDLAGNALASGASDAWTADLTAPTADVVDVSPNPRSTSVASVNVVFSEVVSGVTIDDFALTRDGGGDLLGGSGATVTTGDNITYTINGLSTVTAPDGSYLLTLFAGGSGIVDAVSNALTTNASDAWVKSSTPMADIVDITPDPRDTSVASATVNFNGVMSGVDIGDFTLKLNGGPDLLAGSGAGITTGDNVTFTINGLGPLTAVSGSYELRLVASGSGIENASNTPLTTDAVDTWSLVRGPVTIPGGSGEIQAENFQTRGGGGGHRWTWIATEAPAVGSISGATGPNNQFLQALTDAGADSSNVNVAPADPFLEYQFIVPTSGLWDFDVRAAGVSFTSDSLWVKIDGGSATLANAQGLTQTSGSLLRTLNQSGAMNWFDAGQWNLRAGDVYTIRVDMRESGAVLDSLRLNLATTLKTAVSNDPVTIQGENLTRRTVGGSYNWFVVPTETAAVGSFSGATGANSEFMQVLTSAAADDGTNNGAPSAPFLEFDLNVAHAGDYFLDLRGAGNGVSSDTAWVQILGGATLLDAQGATQGSGSSLLIDMNEAGAFATADAGKWRLPFGISTVRISMAESGAAIDSITVARSTDPTPLVGVTQIEAENASRLDAASGHDWFVVDADTAGVGSFTGASGPDGDYLQSLTTAGADSGAANTSPAGPTADFPIQVIDETTYLLRIKGAGPTFTSDSVWVEIIGGGIVNPGGNEVNGNNLRINLDSSGAFTWKNAGTWALTPGVHTVRVSMRESGSAVDAIELSQVVNPILVTGLTQPQAENFHVRTPSVGHNWLVVDAETPGVGSFTGATGTSTDFLQALTLAGADSGSVNTSPSTPVVKYHIQVLDGGDFDLDLRAAGVSTTSDSIWAKIEGATLVDAQGLTAAGDGSLNVDVNETAAFEWKNSGVWSLTPGVYTIVVSMRESGAALDALRIDKVSNPVAISGATIVQAESPHLRQPNSGFRWLKVDAETAGVGILSGATGPSSDYLQALNDNGTLTTVKTNVTPAGPTAEYRISIPTTGEYQLELNLAGETGTRDSAWATISTGTLSDAQGLTQSSASLLVPVTPNATFAWRDAGVWNMTAGEHTILVSMRESGAGLDALRVSPLNPPTQISGQTTIQSEDAHGRVNSASHRWWIVDAESSGAGSFTGATGANSDYLQALTNAGADDGFGNVSPNTPTASFQIQTLAAGNFDLDLRAAGLSGTSDSIWVTIEGATLSNAEGLTQSGGSLLLPTNTTGAFAWQDAGVWNMAAGVFTVKISMRESGAAFDAIRLEPTGGGGSEVELDALVYLAAVDSAFDAEDEWRIK